MHAGGRQRIRRAVRLVGDEEKKEIRVKERRIRRMRWRKMNVRRKKGISPDDKGVERTRKEMGKGMEEGQEEDQEGLELLEQENKD